MPDFKKVTNYGVTKAQLKGPQETPRTPANTAIRAAAQANDVPVVGKVLADVAPWLDLLGRLAQTKQFVLVPAGANTRAQIAADILANVQNDGHSPTEARGYLDRIHEQLDLLVPMVGRYEIANGVLT